MSDLLRTPLFPSYALQAPSVRCIDFGGWELPVQFSGIQAEHDAVRNAAGLFDVSHMGEFIVSGRDALSFLQKMTTNDAALLEDGHAQYSLMCYPDGGTVDDLLVYRLASDKYMLVVNASNRAGDLAWLNEHRTGDTRIEDRSDDTALIALQGPKAEPVLMRAADDEARDSLKALAPFRFVDGAVVCGVSALVSRTGYTGEDGFELYVAAADADRLWHGLLEAGDADGLIPAGLGARDTLRFEARLPLYGQELSASVSPLEAGLGYFVKLDKGDFVGREALAEQKRLGPARRLVGLEMIDRGIPRAHYAVYSPAGEQIGEVTSGTQSPTLKRSLGLALIDAAHSAPGTELMVDIRGKRLKARVVKAPFYKKQPPSGKGADNR